MNKYAVSLETVNICEDIIWLAFVMWREARGEDNLTKIAVAYSILNRVQRPSWWGKTVYEVLHRKWQYSSVTDPKDKQLTTYPVSENDPSYVACKMIALNVLNGTVENPVPGADSYFDDSIQNPAWAVPEIFVKKLGRISFYNVDKDIEK